MPSLLRSRLALFALLGAFLIPIGMANLRGLTHVLACREQARTPFTLVIPDQGRPVVITSTRIERGQELALCGGLLLDMRARTLGPGNVEMIVLITNNTRSVWRGTIQLLLGNTSIPVDIGEIGSGATAQDSLPFRVDPGSHELTGSLLIGP